MRNTSVTGTAVTISGISTNDYFMVYDSNVGAGSTTINSLNIDGIYYWSWNFFCR